MEDYTYIREKLRQVLEIVAELEFMLPEDPSPPVLRLVKDRDRSIDIDPTNKPPARAGGFPVYLRLVSDEEGEASGKMALDYSKEEIAKMPRLKDGKYRITRDGLHQIRYRREGYDVQFTSKHKKVAEERFREWVKSVSDEKKIVLPKKADTFGDFAERFFTTVKRINVDEETYKGLYRTLQLHILPTFGELRLKQIGAMKCQELLASILDKGFGRTCETVKNILNSVFECAVGEHLIGENPMKYVKVPRHLRKKGTSLSREEVSAFIKACEGSKYQKAFMVFLYTGIRRNEIYSAVFDENFMTVENGKCRKGHPRTWRKIPIAPGLRKYLPFGKQDLPEFNDTLTTAFQKLVPGKSLKDLRHTFTTWTQECGIPKTLVDVWTAHTDKKDMTSSVYTHFSDEFQLEQIQKLRYE